MTSVDPIYVAARRVLLDALQALGEHRDAVVLVGAQAIYLQAGEADVALGVAPYTKDADLSIDPGRLGGEPSIVKAMSGAGFVLKEKITGGVEPGTWLATTEVDGACISVPVDLLVPESLAPLHGKRDARLPEHGKNATRWTPGLEATVVDNATMTINSLEVQDTRTVTIRVAGIAALLVAKAHKIAERLIDEGKGKRHRVVPKDAGDVVRLMRSPTTPTVVGGRLAEMAANEVCGPSVRQGVEHLDRLFGGGRGRGVDLAAEALATAVTAPYLRGLAAAYIDALLTAYKVGGQ